MKCTEINAGRAPSRWKRMLTGSFYTTALVVFSLTQAGGCGKKATGLTEELMGHKIANLGDVTGLNLNGDNPLEGNAEAIANGAKHYETMCMVCHGQGGQGNTGPDLLDNAWLHGGDNFSLYNVISNGIRLEHMKMNPPRGKMPAYKNILGSRRILEVMAWLADQKKKTSEHSGF